MKSKSFSYDGVIALIIGLLIIIFPLKVFTGLAIVVGFFLVIAGFRRLFEKIAKKSGRVVNSILMILIGFVLLGPVFPWFTVDASDILGYLIGGMFIYNGVYRMLRYRKIQTPMNRSIANAGMVAIIIGLVIAFVPFISDAIIIIITVLIGLILIGYGSLRLFVKMNVINKYQEFKQEYDMEDNKDIVDVDVEE